MLYSWEGNLESGAGLRSIAGVPNRNVTLSMPHLAHLIIPFSGAIRVAA